VAEFGFEILVHTGAEEQTAKVSTASIASQSIPANGVGRSRSTSKRQKEDVRASGLWFLFPETRAVNHSYGRPQARGLVPHMRFHKPAQLRPPMQAEASCRMRFHKPARSSSENSGLWFRSEKPSKRPPQSKSGQRARCILVAKIVKRRNEALEIVITQIQTTQTRNGFSEAQGRGKGSFSTWVFRGPRLEEPVEPRTLRPNESQHKEEKRIDGECTSCFLHGEAEPTGLACALEGATAEAGALTSSIGAAAAEAETAAPCVLSVLSMVFSFSLAAATRRLSSRHRPQP
jgi:hypothetical protein